MKKKWHHFYIFIYIFKFILIQLANQPESISLSQPSFPSSGYPPSNVSQSSSVSLNLDIGSSNSQPPSPQFPQSGYPPSSSTMPNGFPPSSSQTTSGYLPSHQSSVNINLSGIIISISL
jgi:hypothetical protein